MLSAKDKESLNWILKHTADLEGQVSNLNDRLTKLHKSRACEIRRNENATNAKLCAAENERLLNLNRHLATLEILLDALVDEIEPALVRKKSAADDPMADYDIDAELHYTLRDNDDEWSDRSDNVLTRRDYTPRKLACLPRGVDYGEKHPGSDVNAEPHCWLFHDLEHSYGLANPRVSSKNYLRLGKVRVDVVIYQQYWLSLDTGEWVKATGLV